MQMRQKQSLQEIRQMQFGVAYDGWEAGWRPIFHAQEERREGRLCVSVPADQCLPSIRRRLQSHGFTTAWGQLRGTLAVQRRLTTRITCKNGRTQHLGKATRPEPNFVRLYPALVSTTRQRCPETRHLNRHHQRKRRATRGKFTSQRVDIEVTHWLVA
jgi:hypothetical protein